MAYIQLAFDKTARSIDSDGRLHVSKSHISKATVNPYYGHEIPNHRELGLDGEKIYHLFRDPKELEKAAPTFERLPILSEHVPVTVDAPRPDLVVGAIGSDVSFNSPYLDADLCIWDAKAIAGIEADKIRELSCAYRYIPVMGAGNFEGMAYDGRMTEIKGNHLALVDVGRAGSDVVVADANPFKDETAMKMTKLGKSLFSAIGKIAPELAADSALPALLSNASKRTKPATLVGKIIALDASIDSGKLGAVVDAVLGGEEEKDDKKDGAEMGAGDADERAEKVKELLGDKVSPEVVDAICELLDGKDEGEAEDEDTEGEVERSDIDAEKEVTANRPAKDGEDLMTRKEHEGAMDSFKKSMKLAQDAAREVRPVVGDVALYDAAEIYAFALDSMRVGHVGVKDATALRAIFKAASAVKQEPASIAQDSAAMSKRFPMADRFSKA